MSAATTQTLPAIQSFPALRPVRFPQDLLPVADLIELCFADTLDADGRRFIRQLRQAAYPSKGRALLDQFSPALTGFVWEQDSRIIGNVSLIPIIVQTRRAYLLANVAVHPDERRRGIAHALTDSALDYAQQSGVRSVWLQVDDRNAEAQEIYRQFGFEERARRAVWHSGAFPAEISMPPSVSVTSRRKVDWEQQKHWLQQLFPSELRWNFPLSFSELAPGISGTLMRAFNLKRFDQWSAWRGGEWIGSLAWQSSPSQADWLWLAAPPEQRELAIIALLPYAQKALATRRKLAVNHPAGEAAAAFETAGFHHHQTLIWMRKLFKE